MNKYTKIWNSAFISIFIANIALALGQYMCNAILVMYAGALGAPTYISGLLMSVFAVTSIVFRFISGPMMDTFNRTYILLTATATLAFSYIGFGCSDSIKLLFIFRLIQGCGMAFGNACCLTIVAQVLPKDKYNTGLGYYSLAQVISQSMGAPIGLWLSEQYGYKKTFIIAAVIMTFACFLASRVKISYVRTKKLQINVKNIISKEALLPSGIVFFVMVGFVTVNSFLAISSKAAEIQGNVGLYFTVTSISMFVTRPMVGRLTDRYGVVHIIIPAIFANIVSFLIISASQSLFPLLLAGFISSFGFGACLPSLQALAMKTVSDNRRGSVSSTIYIGMDLGNLVGPSIAGMIANTFGYSVMWRVMVTPFFIGMFLVFFFRKRINKIEIDFASSNG